MATILEPKLELPTDIASRTMSMREDPDEDKP